MPVTSPFIVLLRFYCDDDDDADADADADVMVNFERGEKDDFSVSERGGSDVVLAVL